MYRGSSPEGVDKVGGDDSRGLESRCLEFGIPKSGGPAKWVQNEGKRISISISPEKETRGSQFGLVWLT